MIKQFQMGIKLLRYEHGIKSSVILGIGMLVLGIVLELGGLEVHSVINAGAYFILITGLWPLQILISLNVPDIVAASPWKKRIQTSVFAISAAVYFLAAYLLVLAVKLIKYVQGTLTAERFAFDILMTAVFILIIMLYMAVSLKFFVAGTILFCILMPTLMIGSQIVWNIGGLNVSILSPAAAVVTGLVAIVAAVLLSYGLLCLLYKKPVSKYSQMAGLRKKM